MESTHILYSPLLQNESKSIVRCDGGERAGAYHEVQHNSSCSAIETAMYIYEPCKNNGILYLFRIILYN